jgi:hypothetical protein
MRWFTIACLFFLIAAQPVLAGGWLREKGKGFMSMSSTVHAVYPLPEYEIGVYADYGLTSRVNIGLDINETPGAAGHALLFLRVPLSASEWRNKIAVELSLGGHHRDADWQPMYRLGLSWGYGFSGKLSAGWMAVESAVEYRMGNVSPLYKLDAIFGLSSSDRIRPMLQLETAIAQNLPFQWKLTPSLLIPGKGNSTWVVGIQRRSFGETRTGLKVALWNRF